MLDFGFYQNVYPRHHFVSCKKSLKNLWPVEPWMIPRKAREGKLATKSQASLEAMKAQRGPLDWRIPPKKRGLRNMCHIALPKRISSKLKMEENGSWEMNFILGQKAYFQWCTVSFREGTGEKTEICEAKPDFWTITVMMNVSYKCFFLTVNSMIASWLSTHTRTHQKNVQLIIYFDRISNIQPMVI